MSWLHFIWGAIALLSGINLLGIRSGAIVQNVLTVLKLAALGALIAVGLVWTAAAAELPVVPVAPVAPVVAIGTALIPVLFAYGGWQSTNFVDGEMREPRRDLPRALLVGVGIVVLVYVLANIVYVRVLGVPGLAASTAPASDVMRRLVGAGGATFIAVGIAVSTFGFLNLAILSAPRVYQAMAADGVFFGKEMVRDAKYFRLATRICAELGAHYVKTYYVAEGFDTVTSCCPVPIVIAGGKKLPELDALRMAHDAVRSGALGVDMGRNIFQSEAPAAMLQSVRAVVHGGETPERAHELFRSLAAAR